MVTTTNTNKTLAFIILISIISISGIDLNKSVLYQAPDECRWSNLNDSNVILVCHLRTINSELENTNFSVIQPQNTIRLRLECNDALFFQSSLSPGCFKNLIELRSLTIEYCKLGNLTDGSFKGLHDLKELTIRTHNSDWSSMSMEISGNVFKDIDKLEYLDLTENNIRKIPDNIICSLKALTHLNVSNNQIQDIINFRFSALNNNSQKSKKCGTFLNVLDLSYNKILNLSSLALSGLDRLKVLNLKQNEMHFIADRAFKGLVSLTVVDLSQNKLKNLPPELFSEAKHLTEIYLRNNSMNILPPNLFSGLFELMILDLSSNELNSQWINSDTFVGLKTLTWLDLSGNKIHKLEHTLFTHLKNLQILKLQDNLIEHIAEHTFSNLSKLHTLILSNNQISYISDLVFHGLNGLLVLSLDNNKISNIDLHSLQNCSNLQDLYINGNKLMSVPQALQYVPLLKTLDLGENLITNIENTSLIHLKNLYGLRLTENFINFIKKGLFDKILSLQILNLSKNKIKHIEKGSFDKNKQLQAIRLDGNFLKSISELFINLPNLVWLNISDNHLDKFEYSHIPTGLQWLDIHANKIYKLGNYFEIESELSLNTFDASSNSLTEITTASIPNSVASLYLSDNLISKIQPYTFFKKTNLSRVDLCDNKITTLEPNAFRLSQMPDGKLLPEFYISGNPFICDCNLDWIQKINIESRTQPKLMDLDSIICKLSYNRERVSMSLIQTKSSEFLCQYETHCFALCHCCDFFACDCKMECPKNCKCYHDQSWTSNVVDCSQAGYNNSFPTHIPMDSTQLYLDGNSLHELNSHTFLGRKRLKLLYLNHSNIEIITNRTFYGLLELEILQLDHNNLNQLNGNEFEGLENLKELFLNNNKIISINNYTFVNLHHLRLLRLDNNLITEFSSQNFFPPFLMELYISNNPLRCDCTVIDNIRNIIKTHNIFKDLSAIKCAIPPVINSNYTSNNIDFKQNRIASIADILFIKNNYVLFKCNSSSDEKRKNVNIKHKLLLTSQPGYMSFLPILSGFLLLIIVLIIVFIFRQEIRIWFYSNFGIRLFCNASFNFDKNERDKLFDAFVSYSLKDETFVVEELTPLLENCDPNYKLCLQYRDFPVGAFISESIVQAIDSSRRTIIVLTENFIKSEWCRYEFKSAHHQVLRDRKRRLIVIQLGDLPIKDLDADMRLYIKTNTFLKWNEKLFWEKLRFALPDLSYDRSQMNSNITLNNLRSQQMRSASQNHGRNLNMTNSNVNQNDMSNRLMLMEQQQQHQQQQTEQSDQQQTDFLSRNSITASRTVAIHI